MSREFKIEHDYSVKYAAWTNRSAETTNEIVLRCLRTLSSKFNERDWKILLTLIEVHCNDEPKTEKLSSSPNQMLVG